MSRRKLIVIDDEPDMGEFVCAVAEGAGFDATCVQRSQEFMASLDHSIDVLVLDLFMPDVDGIELIRFLREKKFEAPVILVSGVDRNVLHSAHELATELGLQVLGSLNKPFRKTELERLLATLSSGTSRVSQAPELDAQSPVSSHDLRHALASRQFIAHFQPQFEMDSRRIVAAEALVRWQSPERGLVFPDRFIPLAERTRTIDDIDDLVLRQAIIQCRAWHDAEMPIRVSVNFSPGTLKDLTFPDRLAALVRAQNLDPEFLSLEITESHVMEDLAKSLDILTRFRMKGFRLSIDDFGTGYSSLEKLARIPFTELKIDRSFVKSIESDPTCQTIARLSIMLAHELDMTVVAEGIETEAAWNTLVGMGCDLGQGYWLRKPMAATECMRYCGN
jgi:EAL domain-containing protein (putative c-di-GMP-specific phosphodiesterase class I)